MCDSVSKQKEKLPRTHENVSTPRWLMGMLFASVFSSAYLLVPLYMLTAIASLLLSLPSFNYLAWIYAAPLILSAITKPVALPNAVTFFLSPMLDYFDYEEISEISDDTVREMLFKQKKTFILAAQPHGLISFCGICSAVNCPRDFRGIKTAVASSLLMTPILKHIMGIFGLMDASGPSLTKHFQKKGLEGCVVIYIGGIAELFLSSRKEERLYLKKRKGFIKYALRCGVDVLPVYLFGNTSAFTVVKNGFLADLSRRMQTSLTYFWGKYYLPIPRDDKMLYVKGKPLGLPHIPEPSNDDVEKWHTKYCEEVTRLFETYKEKVPLYKHKKLVIV